MTLRLALCMAGAISAGAYTAGVVDYLLEALERWDLAKKKWPDHPLLPKHNIVIDVVTGASAGGMEGGILFRQGQHSIRVWGADKSTYDPEWFRKHSRSYKAWVKLTDDPSNPQLRQLLNPSDIGKNGVASLLNSTFIDTIADDLLKQDQNQQQQIRPDYIAKDLELCLSLSNLNGIPYSIPFSSGEAHTVYNYKDFGHFIQAPDNTDPGFGRIPVNFTGLNYRNTDILKQCLKATGAFPIGLKYRTVTRKKEYVVNNPLLTSSGNANHRNLPESYSTLNVDGGMMNNEPFDVAAYLMYRRLKGAEFDHSMSFEECVNRYTESFRVFDTPAEDHDDELIDNKSTFSTILMVDPFPSISSYTYRPPDEGIDLLGIVRKIYTAFRGQLLMKPEDLYRATTRTKGRVATDYSRFMIAPRRKIFVNRIEGTNQVVAKQLDGAAAIACGSLEGFGGFIDQSFREHDYLLGRFNCQHFLQKRFGMRLNESVTDSFIQKCYDDETIRNFYAYVEDGEGGRTVTIPFIPDVNPFGDDLTRVPMFDYWRDEEDAAERFQQGGQPYPVWPELDGPATLSKLEKEKPVLSSRIRRMIGSLGPRLIGTGLVAAIGIYVMKRKSKQIADALIQTVIDELRMHKLVRRQ